MQGGRRREAEGGRGEGKRKGGRGKKEGKEEGRKREKGRGRRGEFVLGDSEGHFS